jgi:hypothetical protein
MVKNLKFLVILISGSKWYKKTPPTGNVVIFDVYKVIKASAFFEWGRGRHKFFAIYQC